MKTYNKRNNFKRVIEERSRKKLRDSLTEASGRLSLSERRLIQNKSKAQGLRRYRASSIKKSTIVFLIALVLVLACIISAIYYANSNSRKIEKYTEVTFISPTQALIFWKSNDETLGYVTFSEKRFGKKEVVEQTSSEPSQIHVVVLEGIPLSGVYMQKHNESDRFWIIPQKELIKYEGSTETYE